MLDLHAELRHIIDALDRAGVAYAIAGGVAVSIYAAPRATEDIDMAIAAEDLDRAAEALEPLGFHRAGRPMTVAGGRLAIQRLVKIEGEDLLPLDLLVGRDPETARLLGDRSLLPWRGGSIVVVTVAALRALKRLRGSPQDRADLEALGPESS